MKKFNALMGALILMISAHAHGFSPEKTFKKAVAQVARTAKTGQIIAISETGPIRHGGDGYTFLFEAVTGSRFGHVGIIAVENGEIFVYEGTPPKATRTPLEAFLLRTITPEGKIQYARSEIAAGLTKAQQKQLVKYMKRINKSGIPYDFFHNSLDAIEQDCSEYVKRAFDAIGINLKGLENINTVNKGAFGGFLLKYYEDSTGMKLPPELRFHTPHRVLNNPLTRSVDGTLPYDVISEKQVLEGWLKAGGLPTLGAAFYQSDSLEEATKHGLKIYQMLNSMASDKPYRASDNKPGKGKRKKSWKKGGACPLATAA